MAHHESFKALGPLKWGDLQNDTNNEVLAGLLSTTFKNAQVLIDSIPIPPSVLAAAAKSTGRARSHTDSAVDGAHHKAHKSDPKTDVDVNRALAGSNAAENAATAAKLRKEWKEVKVGNPRENPLNLSVYKLSAKDGKGSWFARRSIHHGISFDKWRLALAKELTETIERLGPNDEPGTGNIRGLGAERKLERRVAEGHGLCEVFHVSARFPGPTTPRDFVTLILRPDASSDKKSSEDSSSKKREPRQFILASRPCDHPDCPPRNGFVRGTYESVELIREVPMEKPLRRTRSSVDLTGEEREASRKVNGATDAGQDGTMSSSDPKASKHDDIDADDDQEMAVEWLMVTRSDPGGSVPRFMVEKGTPGGIANDAARFIDWLATKSIQDLEGVGNTTDKKDQLKESAADSAVVDGVPASDEKVAHDKEPTQQQQKQLSGVDDDDPANSRAADPSYQEAVASEKGIYSMLTGAIGAASSVVSSKFPSLVSAGLIGSGATDSDLEDDDSTISDADSHTSFVSAEEGDGEGTAAETDYLNGNGSIRSVSTTGESSSSQANDMPPVLPTPTTSAASAHHEKELRKLEQRRRKAQEKFMRTQERWARKRGGSAGSRDIHQTTGGGTSINGGDNGSIASHNQTDKEAQALAKLREKHERELAKQEEKYQREVRRFEEQRRNEERKAEQKRRKQLEREEKQNAQAELERTRAERDVALKQIELLKEQVGTLQAQNTMLVARLGKLEGIPAAAVLGAAGEVTAAKGSGSGRARAGTGSSLGSVRSGRSGKSGGNGNGNGNGNGAAAAAAAAVGVLLEMGSQVRGGGDE